MSDARKVYRGYLLETGEIWEADDFRTVYKILVSHMKDYVHDNICGDPEFSGFGFSDCSGRICVTVEGTDFYKEARDEIHSYVSVMRMQGRCGVLVMRADFDYDLDDV